MCQIWKNQNWLRSSRKFQIYVSQLGRKKNRRSWRYQFFETKPMGITEKNYELNFAKNGVDFGQNRSCPIFVKSNILIEFSNLSIRKKSYGGSILRNLIVCSWIFRFLNPRCPTKIIGY